MRAGDSADADGASHRQAVPGRLASADGVVLCSGHLHGAGASRPSTGDGVKRLRVVALEYRAAGVSKNFNRGPAGDSHVNTPIAVGNGSQDVKHVLGEVAIEKDGSAYFEVPARTSVFFQLLDEKGRCVQTMRSWTLVLPDERFGCVGCHENKLQTVAAAERMPDAVNKAAQGLQPLAGQPPHPLVARVEKESPLETLDLFLGVNKSCSLDPDAPVDGFSYRRIIQPIWDRHCGCLSSGQRERPRQNQTLAARADGRRRNEKRSGRIAGFHRVLSCADGGRAERTACQLGRSRVDGTCFASLHVRVREKVS